MPSTAAIPPLSSLADLPAGRDLERAALRRVAETIAADVGTWRPHVRHDVAERHFVQLHRDPHLDVWLICWTNQQETGLHDHDVSSGAVYVCSGTLVEDRLEAQEGTLRRTSVERAEGTTFDFDASHVHCVRHPEGSPPAVSIHVYSPALWRMGYYEIGASGLLRRVPVTYADELAA